MDIIIIKHTKSACLAQPVEHAAVNRSVGGSSPSTGAIVAARRTSQHLAQQRGVFACMPAAPLRVAKTHFCSARRLRRGFFLFIVSSSIPLTLFSPCTTPACRSVGENMLFRRALRSLRGSSPLAGAIVAARRTSQHLAQQRGVFACMPARKANFATPRATARGVCMYACAKPHRKFFRRGPLCSSSRRKIARRSLCSSFLRNYRTALSFLLRAAASPRFLFFFYRSPQPP